MAAFNAKDSSLWVHDVAVHNMANSLSLTQDRETSEATVFGNKARKSTLGLIVVQASGSGYIDFDGEHAALSAGYTGSDALVVTAAPTSDDGDTAMMMPEGLTASWTPLNVSVGETAGMSVDISGRSKKAPISGRIMAGEAARTATGNGTARQLGAVTADETLFASLHVVGSSGTTPTLDVLVTSDDASAFTTPTTRLTFAQATGRTAEHLSTAGAITDDWWRVQWTIGGTSPSFTFAVIVGIT